MRHHVTPCTITTTAVVKGRRTLPILIAPFTSTYFLKAMVAAVKQLIQTVLFASYKCYKNCTVLILEVRIKLVYFSTPAHNADAVSICTRILKYRVWKIEFDELDFLYISNSNFAGYTGSKNLVQTRQKFQFFKLDFSNSIFQNPSADRYRDGTITSQIVLCNIDTQYWIQR